MTQAPPPDDPSTTTYADPPAPARAHELPPGQHDGTGSDPGAGPRRTHDQLRDLSRLRRTTGSERMVVGVAGGLARHLDVDPVIIRVLFVVLSFFSGAGLLLYAALWLVLGDDRTTGRRLGLDTRALGVVLVFVGVLVAAVVLGAGFGDGLVSIPLILLAGVGLLLAMAFNRRHDERAESPAPPGAPGAPAGWSPAYAPAYVAPTAGTEAYAPGSPYAAPPAPPTQPFPAQDAWTPPPAAPRRTGPILFWPTLALCAFGLGLLGVLDLAGLDVAPAAYPALVVALCGAVLVLGSFWGRAGGVILVGLLAALATAGTAVLPTLDGPTTVVRPSTVAELQADYRVDDGTLRIDLRDLEDPSALLGRSLEIDGGVGSIEVLLPPSVDTTVSTSISGPGLTRVLGGWTVGADQRTTQHRPDPATSPDTVDGSAPSNAAATFTLRANLDVGSIEVLDDDRDSQTPTSGESLVGPDRLDLQGAIR